MRTLANHIQRELQRGEWAHCGIYENELQVFSPINQKDREKRIAEFAQKHGFRLRFYKEGSAPSSTDRVLCGRVEFSKCVRDAVRAERGF
jgi:hypothetical protein